MTEDYIHIDKISIVPTSVGLALARPNKISFVLACVHALVTENFCTSRKWT